MLILQLTLLIGGLEALLSWCWFGSPTEKVVLILAHLAMLAGVAAVPVFRGRPTSFSIGSAPYLASFVLLEQAKKDLPRAA